MTNIGDYKRLKKARVLEKEMKEILMSLEITTNSLNVYRKYIPIKTLLASVRECKAIVKVQLKIVQDVIEDHGKLENLKKSDS